MEKAGKMMWNDTVNANWMRARSIAQVVSMSGLSLGSVVNQSVKVMALPRGRL